MKYNIKRLYQCPIFDNKPYFSDEEIEGLIIGQSIVIHEKYDGKFLFDKDTGLVFEQLQSMIGAKKGVFIHDHIIKYMADCVITGIYKFELDTIIPFSMYAKEEPLNARYLLHDAYNTHGFNQIHPPRVLFQDVIKDKDHLNAVVDLCKVQKSSIMNSREDRMEGIVGYVKATKTYFKVHNSWHTELLAHQGEEKK